jgi:ATP-binding cassette subfamily B multidrug efflux pump
MSDPRSGNAGSSSTAGPVGLGSRGPGGGPGSGRMQPFGGEVQKADHVGKTLGRLLRYMRDTRLSLLLVLLLATVSAAAQVLAPPFIARAVDGLMLFLDGTSTAAVATRVLTVSMLLVLGFYLFGWIADASGRLLLVVIGQRLLLRLRQQIMDKVLRLSLRFFDRNSAGDLLSRLSNDTDVINRIMSMGLARLGQSVLLLLGIIVGMLVLNWRLALASFVLLPVMVLSTTIFSRRARTAYRKTRQTISGVSTELEQNIAGAKVAQAFNRQAWNASGFRRLNAANRDANVGAESITAAFAPTMDVLSAVGIAIVLAYGGYLAGRDIISIGVIVAFLQYVRRFFEPLRTLSMLWAMVQSAIAGAERIFDLLDQKVEVEDVAGAVDLQVTAGRVELSGVDFSYTESVPVLRHLDLVAEPSTTVALVGPTGAGKTTITNLLERFYDIDAGSITIDGQDLSQVTQDSLRHNIGVVLQDTFLFADTIEHNIRYGRPDASAADVEQAARLARADEFIRQLPDGYKTRLTEAASNLSRGQRQLLAIARALLMDPKILILDEATSNIDTRTELLIQDALAELLQGRTSFVIAHRLSTIRRADMVYVIEGGVVVEKGTHDQLLAAGGTFSRIYQSQFADIGQRV